MSKSTVSVPFPQGLTRLDIISHLEDGGTLEESCFGHATRYSLAQPGPFEASKVDASYIAGHLEARQRGFGAHVRRWPSWVGE